MANCKYQKDCRLFNGRMTIEQASSEMYKDTYCRGDNKQCALYLVISVLGSEEVPDDLLPDQVDRAHDFIGSMVVRSI